MQVEDEQRAKSPRSVGARYGITRVRVLCKRDSWIDLIIGHRYIMRRGWGREPRRPWSPCALVLLQ